ncbi:MAG: DNA repair protein RecN [Oscillospiraceae bacterium]|nr:DNA repair protein RecN [Oscillospiraceae bacterium]
MLKELYIENLAIIEKAVITFDNRLNVFSGETGAGKSILIGGINAVLGGRVYKDIVRAGAEKAVITALFDIAETGEELLLTREINSSGNSVARINGKTATAADLKGATAGLIDIHGQHETRLIISAESQLELIDSFGEISLDEYQQAFRDFSTISKSIKMLQNESLLRDEKIELLSERIADLTPYKLKKGEEEEISRELERLRNIQNISDSLNKAYYAINGGEEPGASELTRLCGVSLAEAMRYVPECKELKSRIDSLVIELDDIKQEISPLISENFDIDKLPHLEERMSDFLRLKRKYTMDIDELVDKSAQWKQELHDLQGGDNTIEKLLSEKKRLGDEVRVKAEKITLKRKETADKLSELIKQELLYLDMPDVQIIFEVVQEKVTVTGMDGVELLISVNKGEEMKPASKIASGGELSRIMLAIKSVIAESDDIPTMIFDEIDSGLSGRAAQKVGTKLAELSKRRQVLCVTHLAQIAAMADNHLLIEKESIGERTYTNVKSITGEERKRELARIISGDEDELSMANAERLIGRKT